MRKCCNLPEEAEIHQPTSPIRLLHDSPPPWDEFQRLRSSLRDWRRVGCMWPRLVEMYLSNEREDEKKKKDDDVWTKARNIGILSNKEEAFDETFKNWWQNSEDHQRLFPHEDVWAIKGPVCFNLDTAEWSTELDIADGIEVAEALHGVCGEGMPLREVTSCTLDGALLPDREGVNYTPTEKTPMDSYSLTLMRTRQSPPPSNQTIRRRGLAVLMGQLSSNIWHFSQDYTWLWKLIQLGVLNDSITNAYTKVWLVETKYAAAECEVDGKRCWHSDGGIPGPKDLWQMMVHKLVLSSNLVAKSVESIHSFTDGKRLLRDGIKHVCYDGAIQPWRAWPSGKQYYDTLRETVVAACGLHDTGLTRKVVLLERGSRHRRWSAETATEMTEMITDWGRLNAFTVGWVRPGGLDPCNQVGTLANAAVIIGIGGADMANLLWAPRGAILIEVDAGCYLTTSALSSNGSAYRSHVCRNGQSGVRKQHCHPSAQPFPWRGPGLDYKGEHYNRAKRIYDEAVADERCIDPAETPPPQSTFSADGYRAEFARVKGLAYSAIHRCDCHEPRGHDYDCYHSWLQGEISIDVKGTLMPLLNTLVHDYLLYAFDLE